MAFLMRRTTVVALAAAALVTAAVATFVLLPARHAGASTISGTYHVSSGSASYQTQETSDSSSSVVNPNDGGDGPGGPGGSDDTTTVDGTTDAVSGSATFQNNVLTTATVRVDLTQLQTGDPNRDQVLDTSGLDTDQFPTATMTISNVPVPDVPSGSSVSMDGTGTVTLHGVTQQVSGPVTISNDNGVITLSGDMPIDYADFNITPPESLIASAADSAVLSVSVSGHQ